MKEVAAQLRLLKQSLNNLNDGLLFRFLLFLCFSPFSCKLPASYRRSDENGYPLVVVVVVCVAPLILMAAAPSNLCLDDDHDESMKLEETETIAGG